MPAIQDEFLYPVKWKGCSIRDQLSSAGTYSTESPTYYGPTRKKEEFESEAQWKDIRSQVVNLKRPSATHGGDIRWNLGFQPFKCSDDIYFNSKMARRVTDPIQMGPSGDSLQFSPQETYSSAFYVPVPTKSINAHSVRHTIPSLINTSMDIKENENVIMDLSTTGNSSVYACDSTMERTAKHTPYGIEDDLRDSKLINPEVTESLNAYQSGCRKPHPSESDDSDDIGPLHTYRSPSRDFYSCKRDDFYDVNSFSLHQNGANASQLTERFDSQGFKSSNSHRFESNDSNLFKRYNSHVFNREGSHETAISDSFLLKRYESQELHRLDSQRNGISDSQFFKRYNSHEFERFNSHRTEPIHPHRHLSIDSIENMSPDTRKTEQIEPDSCIDISYSTQSIDHVPSSRIGLPISELNNSHTNGLVEPHDNQLFYLHSIIGSSDSHSNAVTNSYTAGLSDLRSIGSLDSNKSLDLDAYGTGSSDLCSIQSAYLRRRLEMDANNIGSSDSHSSTEIKPKYYIGSSDSFGTSESQRITEMDFRERDPDSHRIISSDLNKSNDLIRTAAIDLHGSHRLRLIALNDRPQIDSLRGAAEQTRSRASASCLSTKHNAREGSQNDACRATTATTHSCNTGPNALRGRDFLDSRRSNAIDVRSPTTELVNCIAPYSTGLLSTASDEYWTDEDVSDIYGSRRSGRLVVENELKAVMEENPVKILTSYKYRLNKDVPEIFYLSQSEEESGEIRPRQSEAVIEESPVEFWTSGQVSYWLETCCQQFDLNLDVVERFHINGAALCILEKEDFQLRSPQHGDVLYNALQRLRRQQQHLKEDEQQQHSMLGDANCIANNCISEESIYQFTDTNSTERQNKLSTVNPIHFNDVNEYIIDQPVAFNQSLCSIQPRDYSVTSSLSSVRDVRPCDVERYVTSSLQEFSDVTPRDLENNRVREWQRDEKEDDVESNREMALDLRVTSSSKCESPDHYLQLPESTKIDSPTDQTSFKNPKEKSHKTDAMTQGEATPLLWEFLVDLLETGSSPCVCWDLSDRESLTFRIVDQNELAALWGHQKRKQGMTYEKLSRALRYYYRLQILVKVPGKQLTYKFLKAPRSIQKARRGAKPGVPHKRRQPHISNIAKVEEQGESLRQPDYTDIHHIQDDDDSSSQSTVKVQSTDTTITFLSL